MLFNDDDSELGSRDISHMSLPIFQDSILRSESESELSLDYLTTANIEL
jgi:hypothetical protein